MTPTPRTKFLVALLATGVLAVGAIAVAVDARPGDGPGNHPGANGTSDPNSGNQTMRQQRQQMRQDRQQVREDRRELRDQIADFCAHAAANSTAAQRCEHLKDAVKARRVALGLEVAIRVHERELGRVDVRIAMVKEKLASGNLTANQTAKAQDFLSHLQQRHDSLVQKIKDEQAKLAALRDRWMEVRAHIRQRIQKGEDSGVPANGTGAPAPTASASGSATETSDSGSASGTGTAAA